MRRTYVQGHDLLVPCRFSVGEDMCFAWLPETARCSTAYDAQGHLPLILSVVVERWENAPTIRSCDALIRYRFLLGKCICSADLEKLSCVETPENLDHFADDTGPASLMTCS
jgi:hypothetical protein